ncbi:class D sortase [Planococcus sp. CAU13]|uniref:class D sortase n=1 Tax=Planococcus sp. CAU13 TaxID=1541197 RepID=UPI00068C7946|nr:class D sortase [Planococcus sp. CAU13]
MKRAKKWIGNGMIIGGFAMLIILALGMKSTHDNQTGLIEAFEAVKTEASTGAAAQTNAAGTFAEAAGLPDGVEGVLTIPAIELQSPVLQGATPGNLNQALGAIEGLDRAGEMDGSYAIAGHQSHIFGQFFNRLNELQIGEHFEYETLDENFSFEVFDIQIVKPEEVEVLNAQKGMALLSLITCYPENSSEFRLIVQAKRIN